MKFVQFKALYRFFKCSAFLNMLIQCIYNKFNKPVYKILLTFESALFLTLDLHIYAWG